MIISWTAANRTQRCARGVSASVVGHSRPPDKLPVDRAISQAACGGQKLVQVGGNSAPHIRFVAFVPGFAYEFLRRGPALVHPVGAARRDRSRRGFR
jgi:hypothetical protein